MKNLRIESERTYSQVFHLKADFSNIAQDIEFKFIIWGKCEMKSVAGNFFKYPFQLLFVLLVLIITQICGFLGKGIHFIFLKNKFFGIH